MATNLIPIRPAVGILASAQRPEPNLRRRGEGASSSNWWSPLFGWSSDPDYIHGSDSKAEEQAMEKKKEAVRSSRFAPGCFTEEKAKQLRLLTSDTSSFHDVMYHSAIASRLASDFKRRSSSDAY